MEAIVRRDRISSLPRAVIRYGLLQYGSSRKVTLSRVAGLKAQLQEQRPLKGFIENGLLGVTRLREKTRAPALGGMWLSSEALAKEEVASAGYAALEVPRAPARGAPLRWRQRRHGPI